MKRSTKLPHFQNYICLSIKGMLLRLICEKQDYKLSQNCSADQAGNNMEQGAHQLQLILVKKPFPLTDVMQDIQHNVREVGNSDTGEGIRLGEHEKFKPKYIQVEEDVKEPYEGD